MQRLAESILQTVVGVYRESFDKRNYKYCVEITFQYIFIWVNQIAQWFKVGYCCERQTMAYRYVPAGQTKYDL